MIGVRCGLRVCPREGVAVGPANDPIAGRSTASGTTLTVTLADSKDPVITTGEYSYAVVVTNTGGVEAANVVCDVQLDAQTAFVSGSGTGWTVADQGGNLIRSTRAALSVGAAPTITINVTAPAAAETSSATADADADNSDPATQDTETTVVNLVDKDATSGIFVPSSATQWTNFRTFFGLTLANPNSLWLCQEASGNLADSIGALTLTATGTPLYNQAVAGWTRTAVAVSADGAADRFAAAAAVGPNPTTTSQMWAVLSLMPAAPPATRSFMGINMTIAATRCVSQHLITSGLPRNNTVAVNADGANAVSSEFHAMVVRYDRTNTVSKSYTSEEKITGTYNIGVLDGSKGFGNGSAMKTVYAMMWSGAAAEGSDADLKALLQAMGLTIAWS